MLWQAWKVYPPLYQLGWGRINWQHPKWQNCFLQIGYGTMVYLKDWYMIVMYVLLHCSGVPCGPCLECEHYLVVPIIRKPTVKWNDRTILLSKLYVLWFMRVLMIGWKLFHSLSCVWTMQWQTQLECCSCLYLRLVAAYASGPLGWVAPQPSGTNHCRNVAPFIWLGLASFSSCVEVLEEVCLC